MDRSQRIGMIVSGVAHLGAILWLIIGGIFFAHDLPPTVATAEVSLMSSAEFAALQARAPTARSTRKAGRDIARSDDTSDRVIPPGDEL